MTRAGLRLLTFALVMWTVCFVVLDWVGTWTPFAFVGLFLAAIAVSQRFVACSLLRPTLARSTIGVASGVVMVIGTHAVYRIVVAFAPRVALATRELLVLLNVTGFSPPVRGLLIVVIAACEEVIFRGLLPTSTMPGKRGPHFPSSGELAQISAFAAIHALTTFALGSPLLVVCALVCGTLWGLLRVTTGSLVAPVLAHVVWDLGVLLIWPIAAAPLS